MLEQINESPFFSPDNKFQLALKTHQVETAFSMLMQDYHYCGILLQLSVARELWMLQHLLSFCFHSCCVTMAPGATNSPPSKDLETRFFTLAEYSAALGQFQLARRCYEMLGMLLWHSPFCRSLLEQSSKVIYAHCMNAGVEGKLSLLFLFLVNGNKSMTLNLLEEAKASKDQGLSTALGKT